MPAHATPPDRDLHRRASDVSDERSTSARDADRREIGGSPPGTFPLASGVLFGLGLGGFFDGIVLHQLLQWHHMLSSWYPTDTLENLRLNTLWDGIFHSMTYLFVLAGLWLLWRTSQRSRLRWTSRFLTGSMLIGWGLFNVVEGLVDHQLLGIHHVNERVAPERWLAWDLSFLAWGAAMLLAGWLLVGRPRSDRSRESVGAR